MHVLGCVKISEQLIVITTVLLLACNVEAQTGFLFINCGTNSTVNAQGRKWIGDSSPGNNVTLSSPGIEASSSTFNGDPRYDPLYRTARIFTEASNYTIQVPNGEYFLRLHFYPTMFEQYNVNESYFSVEANGLKLVSQFNVPGEISNKNSHLPGNSSYEYLLKEYYLSVNLGSVVIRFSPSRGSFAFVNAIEVVQEQSSLFADSVHRVGTNGGDSSSILNQRGLETMYRLNVGGSPIEPAQDTSVWRPWEADSSYMINADAGSVIRNKTNITFSNSNETNMAPIMVYETARILSNAEVMDKRFNMSWKLEVDPDFDYLVRLHFCELVYDRPNQRTFRIFVDNKTAADNYDVYVRAGGMNKAYHEDYLDSISLGVNDIWVQLGPDSTAGSAGSDALLNGLEVFKLSKNGNLAYAEKYGGDMGSKKSSKRSVLIVGIGAGIASVSVLAIVILGFLWFCKKRRQGNDGKKKHPNGLIPLFLHGSVFNSTNNARGSTTGQQNQQGTVRSGRRFTLSEIKEATKNFDESLIIGVGGFGKVFKGELADEGIYVAIKRSNPQSQQGLVEFETEIEMLSKLRHRHLVSLIGFCDEQNEMILVYEYMSKGTLRSHLLDSQLPPLTWQRRVEICIGAARGLHYLHTGSERGIIHRDVKTTNILLDENFEAKVADFGLSKAGPSLDHTHVSTAVKGSFGYLDPEYFRRQQLTDKSDVYSFGVVLFEVVCGRAVINPSLPKDQINLAEWAVGWQRQRRLEAVVDPRLKGKCCGESLARFGEIAEKCLADEGKKRPTMGEVLWHLEYVLQLQEAWVRCNGGGGDDEVEYEVVSVDEDMQSKGDDDE